MKKWKTNQKDWHQNIRTLRALLNLFGFYLLYTREVRVINGTERYGYILGVTEEDLSDKRNKLRWGYQPYKYFSRMKINATDNFRYI